MATTKVSALPSKTTLTGGEEILITDGSTSKKSTITAVRATATDATKLPLAGGTMTGNIVMSGSETVDGVDISARDAVLTSTTTTANAALPKTGGAMTGAITTNSTFDGRDVATDGAKLDGIEASADVTDATNVAAAGALMDSEVTNLAQVKAFDSSDYATAAQGTLATNALPKSGGTMTGNLDLGDNNKLLIGTGNDLEIYHDGSNSYIVDNGTGNLRLQGQAELLLLDGENHHYVRCVNDGAVELYYDNAKKIETTSTGVTVTGTAVATTNTDATNTGSVTLDFAANQNFVLTLTGAVTLANPSTEQVGQSGFITFIQDGTGGRTVSLGTDYETAGGAGLTLTSTASATDIVPYVVVASGRILLGTPQLAFA